VKLLSAIRSGGNDVVDAELRGSDSSDLLVEAESFGQCPPRHYCVGSLDLIESASMAKTLSSKELEDFISRLRATVALADEATTLRKQLDRVVDVVNSFAAGAKKSVSQPRKARKRSRKQSAQLRTQILDTLKKGKLQLKEIAGQVGARSKAVSYALNRLRDEKRVGVVGKRNQARWQLANGQSRASA
jgi:hypothetical protein